MKALFWFRRDLRLKDNAGLYRALKSGHKVQPLFIFDQYILDKLSDKSDARVGFIYDQILQLKSLLNQLDSDLKVYYGRPHEVFKELVKDDNIKAIYTNEDYESYAISRDRSIADLAEAKGIAFKTYKDQVIFDGSEVLKKDGTPYIVFTPYKKKWLEALESRKEESGSYYLKSYPTEKYFKNFLHSKPSEMISLEGMGFRQSDIPIPDQTISRKIIKAYDQQRDFPGINGTSRLGIHYRFGTISIREKLKNAMPLNDTYVSELIWRDFYAQILYHFPHVEVSAFRPKYRNIEWRNDEGEFKKWCKGETGYPLVDAGMRELNSTGHMHNRVRMVVASFLTKHLLIDWRWGEQYFADKLLDFDLASNNGGWQWAAGCGTDAAPYFRIFNPESQMKKFDKDLVYVKKWVPEYGTSDYTQPIVDHKMARERCLRAYKEELSKH